MDVGAWLKNLGLGQYGAAFRDNAIDGDILPSLTAEDLKDIGVTIVGHRRRLLDAIAALGAAPPPPRRALRRSPPPHAQKSADLAAERRPITVHVLRPRRLDEPRGQARRRGLARPRRRLSRRRLEAVTDFGGHVLKKLGDGLMALFGYPHAQENDAERAARAGARDPARARRRSTRGTRARACPRSPRA